jgi:SAM-dependent methyltransferase
MEVLSPRSGQTILDVGCGTGQTVLQLADKVGPRGHVMGVDISPVVLEAARERACGLEHVSFIEGDASALDLPEESIDAVFSRFGVMPLPHPVAAFSNFHRMLKTAGRLAFVCWRSLEENELDFLPLRAADLEAMLDPTPFSFEDPDYVRTTLESAGFKEVAIQAHDQAVTSGDLDAMTMVLLKVGPLGKIIRENPALRIDAEPRVRAALAEKGDASQIALRAATWVVSART